MATRESGDSAEPLLATVTAANENGHPIVIVGSGSKLRWSGDSEQLCTTGHEGVIDYRPDELVVTARSGSKLTDVASVLEDAGQTLPFEPPLFGGRGTLGGAVATGLSGPGRPWFGSVRDALLGVTIVNGMGQRLSFGGQVLKNVAGYDISRLMVGAFGTLGLLLEVSLRVRPIPEAAVTLAGECAPDEALELTRNLLRQPLPVTATAYCDGVLRIRLSGSEESVAHASRSLNLDIEVEDDAFFREVRDHAHPFFAGPGRLWMLSLPLGTSFNQPATLAEWAGARVWWRTDADAASVYARARAAGGFATPFPRRLGDVTAPVAKYMRRVKAAFDPANILNREIAPRAD